MQKMKLSLTQKSTNGKITCARTLHMPCDHVDCDENTALVNMIKGGLRRTTSLLVVISYLTMTMGQSFAMNQGTNHDDSEMFVTPKKQSLAAVVPYTPADQTNDPDSPLSVVQPFDIEGGNHFPISNETKDGDNNKEINPPSSTDKNENRSSELSPDLTAFSTVIEEIFEKDDTTFRVDAERTLYFTYSYTKDSIVDAPYTVANAAIWTAARAKKMVVGSEMPDESAYFKPTVDYNADQAYYGGKKDSYAKALAGILLAGALSYSLKAEGKVFSYTGFDALAQDPYFYEKFYYEHPDDPYYIQNKFMTAIMAYTATLLPFYLLYQTTEFVKNLHQTQAQKQITENYGVYLEKMMGGFIVLSAMAAGFFITADYFVSAYKLKGTPQTTPEDLRVLPIMLGLSFVLTMYNMKKKTMGDQFRDWYRWYYGDKADAEREILLGLVDRYQEKVRKMPKEKSIKPTQIADEDREAQKKPVQTIDDLAQELPYLSGMDIFTKIIDGKLVKERRNAGVDTKQIEALQSIAAKQQHELSFMELLNGTRQLAIKNWPLIVGAIFSAPVAYFSYKSFIESTQFIIAHNVEALDEIGLQEQGKIKYQIIEKYKGYNEKHPYEWLEQCLDPKNIQIVSNETYVVSDDAYYGTDFYNSTTYLLTFTSRKCKGVAPSDSWQAFPQDMNISRMAVGDGSWFSVWENTYAYKGGVPIAANNYQIAEMPITDISTVSKTVAKVGAGFYASGIYVLSTLGMTGMFSQLSTMEMTGLNMALFPSAFAQGLVKASPLIVETYMAMDSIENKFLFWTILTMISISTALTFVDDFIKVSKKIGKKVFSVCFDKNKHEDVSDQLITIKDMIRNMKSDLIKALYKKHVLYV